MHVRSGLRSCQQQRVPSRGKPSGVAAFVKCRSFVSNPIACSRRLWLRCPANSGDKVVQAELEEEDEQEYGDEIQLGEYEQAALGSAMEEAAGVLMAYREILPEVGESTLGFFLTACPGAAASGPEKVREKLLELQAAFNNEVELESIMKLASKVGMKMWEAPAAGVAARLSPLKTALDAPWAVMTELVAGLPGLWDNRLTHVIKDRVEDIGIAMGCQLSEVVQLLALQPVVWHINPKQVRNRVSWLSESLGVSERDAILVVAAMPVILALDPRCLRINFAELSSALGLSFERLLPVLQSSVGMVAVPSAAIIKGATSLAEELQVTVEDALGLALTQPALLFTKVTNLKAALDVLVTSLKVSHPQALALLAEQPALLYDFTPETVNSRLEGLAATFEADLELIAHLAGVQPALLVLSSSNIRSGVTTLAEDLNLGKEAALKLLVADPGGFMQYGCISTGLVESWGARLEVAPDAVAALLINQPALLEVASNTVKARLESLAAVFGMPADVTLQLVLKHPALMVIPPNVTITKIKDLSAALKMSMQRSSKLVSRDPAVLMLAPEDLNTSADYMLQVTAAYDFYTVDWLQKRAKEMVPVRGTTLKDLMT